MSAQKTLCIGLSLSPTWLSAQACEEIYSPSFYINLAEKAEKACLDFLFRPDALFLDIGKINKSPAFGGIDPSLLISSIAQATRHIGFVSTLSTLFYPPFIAARQLQSLNWITQGRIGWNIVTALQGHQNFGQDKLPSSQERYKIAKEFTHVVELLWESYPNQAIKKEKQAQEYQDNKNIKPINFQGEYFSIQGPLNLPAYQAKIPYFQAGASPDGRDFAASTADGIFTATPNKESAITFRQDIHQRAIQFNRSPNDIRVLPGLSFYLAPTREDAYRCFEQTHQKTDKIVLFRYIHSLIGLDLTHLPENTEINEAMLPKIPTDTYSQTHANLLIDYIRKHSPTIKTLLSIPEVNGSAHWRVIGTADDLVDEIELWVNHHACDGFIALPCGSEQSLTLFFEQVIPTLVKKGLFRSHYQETHLWARLHQSGHF